MFLEFRQYNIANYNFDIDIMMSR